MSNSELHKSLFQNANYEWSYDINSTKQFTFIFNVDLETFLEKNNISFEKIQGDIVFIKTELPYAFFMNFEEYSNEVKKKSFSKDCLIHNYEDGKTIYYDLKTKKAYIENHVLDKYLFQNAIVYFDLLNFLETESNSQDVDFEFTDYFSKTTRKITLTSLVEKSKITFKYPQNGIPKLPLDFDLTKDFQQFKLLYNENKYFPVFLKNSIISKLKKSQELLFLDFFNNLKTICKEAKLNFGVYIHQLSLDTIKTDYRNFKKDYYSAQNEILNKISSQIIALPISIAGSAFAINKIQESTFGVFAICFGLVLFLIYMTYIISIYWKDLIGVQKEMDRDYNLLSSQDFFIENSSELQHFEEIKISLYNRVETLKNSLRIFCTAIWLMTLVLILYAFSLMYILDKTQYLFYTIGFISIYTCIDYYLIFKDE